MAKLQVTLQVWGNNHSKMLSIQGEAGSRTVEVTFLDASGTPIDLTGCTPRMSVNNGNPPPMNDGTIVDAAGGVADFTITSDMLTRAGDWTCEFALAGPNYPLLKANGLMLHVEASNTENAVGSVNQLASLWIALNKADVAAQQTEQAEKNSETAVKNANTAITTVTANESTRQANEQTRQGNESTRKSDEDARKTAETARAREESTRQSDETTRQTQEQARKDAESTRATNETTREGNENTRKANETARVNSENTRASNEDTRKTDESTRQTQESSRVDAEKARANAEAARKTAESGRATAEQSRATAEQNRVSAESARVIAENKRATDSQTAVSNADAATTRANAAAKNAEDAIAGQLDPSIDSCIAAKINASGGIMGYDDAHAHILDGDIHVTPAQKAAWTAKAERSSTSTASVSASAWTGSAAPYSATVSVTGGKPEPTRIEVQPTNDATAEQWAAWRAALIRGGGQDTDKITLLADGDKPGIDIPITATIRGDVQ